MHWGEQSVTQSRVPLNHSRRKGHNEITLSKKKEQDLKRWKSFCEHDRHTWFHTSICFSYSFDRHYNLFIELESVPALSSPANLWRADPAVTPSMEMISNPMLHKKHYPGGQPLYIRQLCNCYNCKIERLVITLSIVNSFVMIHLSHSRPNKRQPQWCHPLVCELEPWVWPYGQCHLGLLEPEEPCLKEQGLSLTQS